MTARFDRVRPRSPQAAAPTTAEQVTRRDGEGRRALFTAGESVPALGAISIECSSCRRLTVVGLSAAVRAMLPSLYLPVLRRRYDWWLRCPACRRRTWADVSIRL
ncbi:MAG TPA: hypothetical protein VKP64_12385 [Mycobacteriales bacterium]|nr:hypothetical protein [Mycobacteriales bacterium]